MRTRQVCLEENTSSFLGLAVCQLWGRKASTPWLMVDPEPHRMWFPTGKSRCCYRKGMLGIKKLQLVWVNTRWLPHLTPVASACLSCTPGKRYCETHLAHHLVQNRTGVNGYCRFSSFSVVIIKDDVP